MSKKAASDTRFTSQVKVIIGKIYGQSIAKDSLLERATAYFEQQPYDQKKLDTYKEKITELSNKEGDENAQQQLKKVEREFKDYQLELKLESNERHKHLLVLCKEIIDLTEGSNFTETNRKSAQFLGTIQLLCPTEGKKVSQANEKAKPLYKAILCLRLLDKLCIDHAGELNSDHIKPYLADLSGEAYQELATNNKEAYQAIIDNVKIPVIMAALIQDIGHFHQDAQKIVCGTDGQSDPYRTLVVDDRKALLQINYRETIRFLAEGLGAPSYVGNSKADREKFNSAEHKKLVFIKQLLKSSITPKQGIGNLLKVPQIYASIILSTKSSYNYKLLPKVYQALNQNAERGTCSQTVVDALRIITGDFPQGFGVTYIPKDSDGKDGEHYEYGVVNQLYPKAADQPVCRMATRSLTFISHGQDIEVPMSSNLYNIEVAKKFSALSKDRLNEILERLSSNYQERKQLDLLPRCWQAGDFFSMKDNQKLWNKS